MGLEAIHMSIRPMVANVPAEALTSRSPSPTIRRNSKLQSALFKIVSGNFTYFRGGIRADVRFVCSGRTEKMRMLKAK